MLIRKGTKKWLTAPLFFFSWRQPFPDSAATAESVARHFLDHANRGPLERRFEIHLEKSWIFGCGAVHRLIAFRARRSIVRT